MSILLLRQSFSEGRQACLFHDPMENAMDKVDYRGHQFTVCAEKIKGKWAPAAIVYWSTPAGITEELVRGQVGRIYFTQREADDHASFLAMKRIDQLMMADQPH